MSVKSHKSAIVIVPQVSPEFLEFIQNIRQKHDKAFKRWMPHINLIYPFYERESENFKKDVTAISRSFKNCGVSKFRMKFSRESVAFFEHSANFNIYIKPLPIDLTLSQQQPSCTTKAKSSERFNEPNRQENSNMPLGFVDPFLVGQQNGLADENNPSLFDLHKPFDLHNATQAENENSASGASFSNFADRNYAFWEMDHSKRNIIAGAFEEKLSKTPNSKKTKSEQIIEASYTSEDLDYLGNFSKDWGLERIQKLPMLQRLQASMVKVFPECDDLNTISESGFQPHLTLGQFKKMDLQRHLSRVKDALFFDEEEEEEVEFEVDKVLIITRSSADDPFEVRATIDLP